MCIRDTKLAKSPSHFNTTSSNHVISGQLSYLKFQKQAWGINMQILIFLFAMITFVLMASDPRLDRLDQRDVTAQNDQKIEHVQYDSVKDDSEEST